MEIDRNGFEIPSREECLELIRHRALGRLAIHTGALPAIVPVNFVLTADGVVVRTAPGTKLAQALRNAVVAFEVDDYDAQRHTGWSVNVVGIAHQLTDPAEVARAERLPLAVWGPGERTHFVRISLDVVSGRRIAPVVAAAPASAVPALLNNWHPHGALGCAKAESAGSF